MKKFSILALLLLVASMLVACNPAPDKNCESGWRNWSAIGQGACLTLEEATAKGYPVANEVTTETAAMCDEADKAAYANLGISEDFLACENGEWTFVGSTGGGEPVQPPAGGGGGTTPMTGTLPISPTNPFGGGNGGSGGQPAAPAPVAQGLAGALNYDETGNDPLPAGQKQLIALYLRIGAPISQAQLEQAVGAIQAEAAAVGAEVHEGETLTLDQRVAWLVWCPNASGWDTPADVSDIHDHMHAPDSMGRVYIQVPFAEPVPLRGDDTWMNCNGGASEFWAVKVY